MKTMEAGPELDALVAEKVMGLDVAYTKSTGKIEVYLGKFGLDVKPIPPYSTDIAAAWAVVEHFQSSKAWCAPYLAPVGGDGSAGDPDGWIASFDYGMPDAVFATTAEHAICLAALKAAGVDVEQPDAERYPLSRGD